MPRKGNVTKREVLPDPVYSNANVTRLINCVMKDGKRSIAQHICYGAFDIIREKTGRDPMEVFEEAINNIMPVLEVKPRRVGGATYQVPVEVRPERRISLTMRWLVNFARQRNERTMEQKLANEIMDAVNNTGGSIRRKEEMHRMAEANRAFAHYRW
ncbi:30S ribosomal protein S7 [Mahella australiensis]|uniref:Small ribosomal subunit protein uS7 n=1 Tax=Mahella australiensis (strain DSM 15567 / CIP 107919 / 50-1 BON) TaxID=697281 RepID=F4A2Y9_MAHA5|nr:30S ribosomal protein S7 [Mahella australiensis]AEE97332.1 SSU ribosomal protein S7P [Mahella australiensis 50-1 BON]